VSKFVIHVWVFSFCVGVKTCLLSVTNQIQMNWNFVTSKNC
jgi:hypothetical protein